jgi:ABC-type uncharacterized transport system substrate-binding protein
MANIGSPIGTVEMGQVQGAAHKLRLEVVPAEIRRVDDIAPAIEALKGRADGLYVVTEPLVNTNRIHRHNRHEGASRCATTYVPICR